MVSNNIMFIRNILFILFFCFIWWLASFIIIVIHIDKIIIKIDMESSIKFFDRM